MNKITKKLIFTQDFEIGGSLRFQVKIEGPLGPVV
jgi:hypothetical protein